MNKDNRLDLSINSVAVIFGLMNGTFASANLYSLDYNARPQSVTIADFNNGNGLDIAVPNDGATYVEILLPTALYSSSP
jgi:hypothetical protein